MDHNYTTHNSRLQVLEQSSEKIQFFYNKRLVELSIMMSTKYHLEKIYVDLILTLGDIILGFYRTEDTVPLLQQELGIDATTAGLLGADVLEFLAPLSDPTFVVPEEEDAETEETIVSTPIPAPSTHSSATFYIPPSSVSIPVTGATPIPTEEVPHVPEIRTMASDMARSPERTSYEPIADVETPVYTSEQPPVRTPLSDLPAYTSTPDAKPTTPPATSIETPRWGA